MSWAEGSNAPAEGACHVGFCIFSPFLATDYCG